MIAWLAVAALCGVPAMAEPVAFDAPRKAGRLDASVTESSGLAASRRLPGHFWTHNDSGHAPVLTLIDATGTAVARVTVRGGTSADWEDLASFTLDGRPYLLIADTGDNLRRRPAGTLLLLPEPEVTPIADTVVTTDATVLRRTDVTYADGPRDVEAVAVDPASRQVVMVSKELDQRGMTFGRCGVYVMPLSVEPAPRAAAEVARVAELPFALSTAMDIRPDGSVAVVATYGDAYAWPRAPHETWAEAFGRDAVTVPLPPRGLGEALAFGVGGGSLWLTSEGVGKPLWELPALNTSIE